MRAYVRVCGFMRAFAFVSTYGILLYLVLRPQSREAVGGGCGAPLSTPAPALALVLVLVPGEVRSMPSLAPSAVSALRDPPMGTSACCALGESGVGAKVE